MYLSGEIGCTQNFVMRDVSALLTDNNADFAFVIHGGSDLFEWMT